MSMYHFRDDVKPLVRFLPTVLELVRLIQVGLSLFDMFPMEAEQQNGLLCDATVDGIRTWIAEIGEPYLKIEVCALFFTASLWRLTLEPQSPTSVLRIQ